jgi:tetratricopeptide (TPR) repeat protein
VKRLLGRRSAHGASPFRQTQVAPDRSLAEDPNRQAGGSIGARHATAAPMTTAATALLAEAQQALRDPRRADAAISLLERAIEVEPSCGDAYHELASIYHARGWYRRELALWLGRFDLDPSDPAASEQIGWILWFLGRAHDALPWLQRTVTLQPSSRWATFYQGNVFPCRTTAGRARCTGGSSSSIPTTARRTPESYGRYSPRATTDGAGTFAPDAQQSARSRPL